MKILITIVLTFSMHAFSDSTDVPLQASVLPESRITIEGSSTVNRFKCEADAVQGSGWFWNGRAEAWVSVPVESFECGKSRMNRDLRRAMKADEHPQIRFEMTHGTGSGTSDLVRVHGELSIAGVARTVEIEASVERQSDDTYRVRGRDELNMSTFGIDPPVAMAGLIRAHDRIVVHFDLAASTTLNLSGRLAPAKATREDL